MPIFANALVFKASAKKRRSVAGIEIDVEAFPFVMK